MQKFREYVESRMTLTVMMTVTDIMLESNQIALDRYKPIVPACKI